MPKLKTLASKIGSGATPRGGGSVYVSSGVALIRSQNVHNGQFVSAGLAHISSIHADELANVAVEPHDVLLNITGDSVARTCVVDTRYLPARVNQHVAIIRPNAAKLNARYLHYVLVSSRMQGHLLQLASAGATRNALTKSMIEELDIPCPPLSEQEAIAVTLGAFDDKIELNRRMNETLEATARAIFKSWFVDFDPVRAKAEGRQPQGIPAHIADLFPDSFQDSPLGPIPKGWLVEPLEKVALLNKGTVTPAKSPTEVFEHFSLPAYDDGQLPKYELGGEIKSNKTEVPVEAVLQSKLNPRFPRIWLVQPRGEHKAICSTEFYPLIAKFPLTRELLYCLLWSQPFQDQFRSMVTGTSSSHQRVNSKSMMGIEVAVPPEEVTVAASEVITPLLDLIAANRNESRILAETRDTLLPKLLSGEVQVL